ncbi:hypothetical protein ACFL35_07495 [Candidatus Riflebacteria bacterium]
MKKSKFILYIFAFFILTRPAFSQELSLFEKDKLLKSMYYYQRELSPQVRRMQQVYRQMTSLLADPKYRNKTTGMLRAQTDKKVLFNKIRSLYERFENFYNFEISLKHRYIPEVEAAKNSIVSLVNRSLQIKTKIEDLLGKFDSEKEEEGGEGEVEASEQAEAAEEAASEEGEKKGSVKDSEGKEDLLKQMFSEDDESKKPSEYLDKKLKEDAVEIKKKQKEDLFAYEKRLFKKLDSEVESRGITFTGSLGTRLQFQKETRKGDTLGRDFGSFNLDLLWTPSARWKVNFYDDFKAQYFLNHWVRNVFGSKSKYQHNPDALWTFGSALTNNYFTNSSNLNYNNWTGYIDFLGDYRETDEFNARFDLEYEWYPEISFNNLWRLRGHLAYDTVFSAGGRVHMDSGAYHENLRHSDSFDNNNFYLNGDWFRQFDSGETWSIANYLTGRNYNRQDTDLYISNWWDDNFILEYHNPLTSKTDFSVLSDFFIKEYNAMDERDYYEWRGRFGIDHFWRKDHSIDTGLELIYHDDGFAGKSHYKVVLDAHYQNKVSDNLLLELTENLEVREATSGNLLDTVGNDFILNLTWYFTENLYPGFRVGSILKEYEDRVFTDFHKILVGANLKYKFGKKGVAYFGTDLFPTYYRNGNTTPGSHYKFIHRSVIRVDTPLSNIWYLSMRARAENRFDTIFSSLTDELMEDYYTELDLAGIDLSLKVIF